MTEVNVLGVVEHPNLVKLIGYCAEDDERGIQRLLVYEYMPNRSVQDHLSNRFQTPLPWSRRLRIAQDTARGLAYLHEEMDFQVLISFHVREFIAIRVMQQIITSSIYPWGPMFSKALRALEALRL